MVYLRKSGVILSLFTGLILCQGLLFKPHAEQSEDFICREYLSRPTAHSININVIPADNMTLYAVYGLNGEELQLKTENVYAIKGRSENIVIDGLNSGTTYYYRLKWKKTEEEDFSSGRTGHFTTARETGDSFQFAVVSDSHIYQKWYMAKNPKNEKDRLQGENSIELMDKTLENILQEKFDFLITLGDEAMPHCYYGHVGSSETYGEAEERYRVFRSFYSKVSHVLPIFFVLGNHEGESPFVDTMKSFSPEMAGERYRARLKHVVNPEPVTYPQGGGERQNYYAFQWGDALFIILDPYSYTEAYPTESEMWTLGDKQFNWLSRTLRSSKSQWKFIFCHQFVGGKPGYIKWGHAYGKGGINAVPYGEQAEIHELMKKHQAHIFFYGHDHVYADGVREGIHYTACGSSASPYWGRKGTLKDNEFNDNYNHDFIVMPGFADVEVSRQEVRVSYVRTDIDGEDNGKIADCYTLQIDDLKHLSPYERQQREERREKQEERRERRRGRREPYERYDDRDME